MEFAFDKIWNFTLFIIDNQQVTIGNAIIAFLVLIIVNIIGRFFRLRSIKLSRRWGISSDGIVLLDKFCLIVELLISSILILKILHIPITELTVFGSAVAIGIGFAAKNILNNTVSGFVILLEQAIQVGDVIQLGDKIGTIRAIGIRSTIIHTAENIDVILPNSNILDSEVINWTMQNNQILTHIEVGIAYNTDVHCATDVMLSSVNKLQFVLAEPKPFVLFSDFGDGILNFQIYFAIEISNRLDRLKKESQVRYQLFDDFKKAGIAIAFPQTDTHLDTSKPLDLRILKEANLSTDKFMQ